MIRPLTFLLLAAPLLLSAAVSTETVEKEELAQEFATMLRGGGEGSVSAETARKEEMAQEFAMILRGSGEAYEFGTDGFGYGYGSDYGGEMQDGRRLGAWSWSNLLCTFNCCSASSHRVLYAVCLYVYLAC
jgi:hypothetical protein